MEILLVESGILSLESRIKLKESGIPLTNGNEFYLYEIKKNHFHISGFALRLALRRRDIGQFGNGLIPESNFHGQKIRNHFGDCGIHNPKCLSCLNLFE